MAKKNETPQIPVAWHGHGVFLHGGSLRRVFA
jgi:hypothetical protein